MIKKHGVALTQFVLCGDNALLLEYMSSISKANRLDFIQEFFMLEKVLDKEPLVIEDYMECLKYSISPEEFRKIKRYYEKKPNTTWIPPLSEEEFNHLNSVLESKKITLPNGFVTDGLTPSQTFVASRIFKNLKDYYAAFNFADMKNFQGGVDVSTLFGVNIVYIRKVLEAYKSFGTLNIIRRMHLILCKFMEAMEDSETYDVSQPYKLENGLKKMKANLDDLPKLFGEELPELTNAEMAVVWLRLNEAGIIGIDNIIDGGIRLKTQATAIYNTSNRADRFLYTLLEKDMNSVILEEWRSK